MPASGTNNSGLETPPSTNFRFFNTMPHPGQSSAPLFDGTGVTEFLWNIECEDVSLSGDRKCDRFPLYCVKDVKDVV